MKNVLLFMLIIFSLCSISVDAVIEWHSESFDMKATVTTNNIPIIVSSSENPPDTSTDVAKLLTNYFNNFNISITDVDNANQSINVTWRTNESGAWQDMGYNQSDNCNQTFYCDNVSWVDTNNTYYWWSVNVSDNATEKGWANATFMFRTELDGDAPVTVWYSSTFDINASVGGWGNWCPWWTMTRAYNDPPTNFTATDNSSTAIILEWDKDPLSQTTRIVRKKGSVPSSFPDGGTIIYNDTGEYFDDTGLDVGTLYGYGAWSWDVTNSDTFVTDYCYSLPSEPSALTNISLGAYNVLLSWTKGTNATDTIVVRNNTGVADYPSTPTDGVEVYNASGSQGTMMGLYPNNTYYFSAFSYIAYAGGYASEGFDTHMCTTLESTDDPSGLTAEPYNESVIDLVWTGGAYPIVIIRKEGSYPTNQTDGTEIYNGSALSYQDTGLNITTHYYYSGWAWTGVSYGLNVTQDHTFTRPLTPVVSTTYALDTNLTISWIDYFIYLTDDFETDLSKWTPNGWERDTGQEHGGSYSVKGMDNDGDLISPIFNTSDADTINLSFWFRDDDCEANDMNLMFWNGSASVDIFDLCSSGDDSWHYYSIETNSSDYKIDGFYFYFDEKLDATSENIWIDDVTLWFNHTNETHIIRKSTSNWVTSPTGGTSVYNGEGFSVVDPYITSMVYYSMWTYSATSGLYSRQENITWGGLAINCHNESDASQNLTFDLFVTNVEGTETYIANDLTNTYYIDVDDLPTGNRTVVQISSDGYKTRYYYMDLFPNTFYILEAYLPLAEPPGGGDDNSTYADLYLFTVENFYSDPVDSAQMTIQRYIPEEDEYLPVSILYTDATGQCSLYLLPESIYKITIVASGYETEIVDFTADPEIRLHTFRLDFIDITADEDTEGILEGISFTILPAGHYHNGNFTIYYNITSDDSKLEWFRALFYEWNSSALTWDLLYSENNTASASGGSIDYFVENNTGKYKMDAYFKKENFSEYEVIQAGSTIWFISWGGLAQSGLADGIPDFVYLLVIVILCAIAMAFFMPMAGLGTGYIGIGIMAFGLILKPDLMLSDGSTGWMILTITTVVYTLGLFLWSRL